MTRDYKDSAGGSGKSKMGETNKLLLGIVIGLVLGLVIALGVAWTINKSQSPFKHLQIPEQPGATQTPAAGNNAGAAPTAAAPNNQQRFDFYKILPGSNDTTGTPATTTTAKPKPATTQTPASTNTTTQNAGATSATYFLQVGAFQNVADADSLKAKLALQFGMQASVQSVNTADKGTLYRVRTGPYATMTELDTARATLTQNNIQSTLVKGQ